MKLVLIGGGNNGHTRSDGTKTPYELKEIDEFISNLTADKKLLFIGHANKEFERTYLKTIKAIYEPLGFECKIMQLNFIKNLDKCKELLDWSSIIYIGGGNTKVMLDKWKEYHFDKLLLSYLDKKIIVGISAGACIFFDKFNTDSYLKETGEYKIIDGLGVIHALMTPHANEKARMEVTNNYVKKHNITNLAFSKSIALYIKDDRYQVVACKLDDFTPYINADNREIEESGMLSNIIRK